MPRRSTPDDFWKHIARGSANQCWPWRLCKDEHGYGRVRYQGREWAAHRLAWALTNGDPGKAFVLHHCDNPPCCNPAHNFLGNSKSNAADMVAKGRHPRNKTGYLPSGDKHHARMHPELMARGERNGSAILTADDVRDIRRRAADGESQRGIARHFGVVKATIQFIITRQTWKHID